MTFEELIRAHPEIMDVELGLSMGGIKEALFRALNDAINNRNSSYFNYCEIGCATGKTTAAVCHFLSIHPELNEAPWRACAIDMLNGWSFNFSELQRNLLPFKD